ncbi:MAG TPA: hypothetical protein VGJ97_12860 [Anaerolineaceae bacterium]
MLFHQISFLAHPGLYMDPGTGSMLVQIILAALLGIGVAIRLFWSKIRGVFGARNPGTLDRDDDQEDD